MTIVKKKPEVVEEVAEETGLRIKEPSFLFDAYMSPGVFSERMSFLSKRLMEAEFAWNRDLAQVGIGAGVAEVGIDASGLMAAGDGERCVLLADRTVGARRGDHARDPRVSGCADVSTRRVARRRIRARAAPPRRPAAAELPSYRMSPR